VLDRIGECCLGTLLASGDCCETGDVDAAGACCEEAGGTDACGVCGGSAEFTDLLGVCCDGPESSHMDALGACCTLGVDECGICGGDGTSCGLAIEVGIEINDAGVVTQLLIEGSAARVALAASVASQLGISDDLVAVTSVVDVSGPQRRRMLRDTSTHQRRLQASQLEVEFAIEAGSAVSASDAAESLESEVGDYTVVNAPDVTGVGDPGNDVCEVGERCEPGDDLGVCTAACCVGDCPYVEQECADGDAIAEPCSGEGAPPQQRTVVSQIHLRAARTPAIDAN